MKWMYLNLLVAVSLMTACSYNKKDPAPHTGNVSIEQETADKVEAEIDAEGEGSYDPELDSGSGKASNRSIYFVTASRLRVRSTPSFENNDNIVGHLNFNDQVEILSEPNAEEWVEIKIINVADSMKPSESYYTSMKFLSKRKLVEQKRHKYFMIQNIATERLRIYEKKCNTCAHKLILDVDMVAGENKAGRKTQLGYYHITSWHKFYQDGRGAYPSWYSPKYMMPPPPKSSIRKWASKKYLPYKDAAVRGAFGWYTAKVGPNSAYQWTHGTVGWGADKDKFIKMTRKFWANLFTDPRSHGCSRVDNETIAFIRQILAKGSPVIKVYAKEAYGDSSLSGYSKDQKEWPYILTTDSSKLSARSSVLREQPDDSTWLEEGIYKLNAYPIGEAYKDSKSKSGKNGNVYGVPAGQMQGHFLIDEGRLVSYNHPSSVKVGGYKNQMLPSYAVAPKGISLTPLNRSR